MFINRDQHWLCGLNAPHQYAVFQLRSCHAHKLHVAFPDEQGLITGSDMEKGDRQIERGWGGGGHSKIKAARSLRN